jgi:succinate dehydrogenase / fumarate reductase flavoprotein subunit
MEPYDTFECDVLIIGAGGAGLRAAIAAKEAGARTCLVCKSLLGKAHTVMAEGGAAAALANMGEPDSWEVHFLDTMKGGAFLNNPYTAEIFAKEAPDRILELEKYGAVFDRTPEGKISQRPFGAHTYRRLNHVGDRTGLELIRTLQDKAVGIGVDCRMEITLTRLLLDSGRVAGAFGYSRDTGKFVLFRTKAAVIATGGWGKIYRVTSNSWESTGDGAAMAYMVGAELQDMEMVQFHPTGMVWPPGMHGLLVTEAVRGEGGILTNSEGERFLFNERYMPARYKGTFAESSEEAHRWLTDKKNNRRPPELLPRDVVARAIHDEVREGRGSTHGGVYLDVSHRGAAYIKSRLPSMYEQFIKLGDVDITRQKMEVAPTIHYAMGGLWTEAETCATNLPGLYAAGECACGVHGANRLGGNALSDLLVFGRRAGLSAAEHARTNVFGSIDSGEIREEAELLLAPFTSTGTESPHKLHRELQEIMAEHAGIRRNRDGMSQGLEKVLAVNQQLPNVKAEGGREYNPVWHACRDVRNMAILCEALLRSGLAREESRGAHFRTDLPAASDEWGKKSVIVVRENGEMTLKTRAVPEMPPHLKKLVEQSAGAAK